MSKGEIARFVQFLLLSLCFQKTSAANALECVCKWERVKDSNGYTILGFVTVLGDFYNFSSIGFGHDTCNFIFQVDIVTTIVQNVHIKIGNLNAI